MAASAGGLAAVVHGRRCRAQLCGQRTHPQGRTVRGGLRAARGVGCGRRARRGDDCTSTTDRRAAGGGAARPRFSRARVFERRDPRAARRQPGQGAGPQRRAALADHVAERLARGEVVGWFRGAMEFGPRALGADRSWPIHETRPCAIGSTPSSRSGKRSGCSRPPSSQSARTNISISTTMRRSCSKPARSARRWICRRSHTWMARPAADGARRHQSAVSRAAASVRAPHRVSDPAQHVVQSAGEPIVCTPVDASCVLSDRISIAWFWRMSWSTGAMCHRRGSSRFATWPRPHRRVEHGLHAAVNESLRGLTRQLAQTLASDDGGILLARMQRLALAAARGPARRGPITDSASASGSRSRETRARSSSRGRKTPPANGAIGRTSRASLARPGREWWSSVNRWPARICSTPR